MVSKIRGLSPSMAIVSEFTLYIRGVERASDGCVVGRATLPVASVHLLITDAERVEHPILVYLSFPFPPAFSFRPLFLSLPLPLFHPLPSSYVPLSFTTRPSLISVFPSLLFLLPSLTLVPPYPRSRLHSGRGVCGSVEIVRRGRPTSVLGRNSSVDLRT